MSEAGSIRDGKAPEGRPLILVVDDDPGLLKLVAHCMQAEGYRVVTAADGQRALQLVEDEHLSLILLDIMMPGMDGLALCKRLREFSDVPVIMLTARGQVEDVVLGLDCGADDYVVKPFDTHELLARVSAVLRRARPPEALSQASVTSGDLHIDFARHLVTLKGIEVRLTPTEYRLLALLASNAGRVVTQDHLLHAVWGPEYSGETHILQVAVARLRKKIGDEAASARYLTTRSGIGYSFKG